MAGIYRIRKQTSAALAGGGADFQGYLDRLMRMIPGDAVGLYLVGSGLIPGSASPIVLTIWAAVCLIAVILLRMKYTADPANNAGPQGVAVLIASVAFVIWVYTIGGPFAKWNLAVPYVGSLLVLAWTFFVPLFYKGD